jgi:hypothetical protein
MKNIYIDQYEDSFVVHFGVSSNQINAYTLASTLVNLADAAKVANASINPGYEIEILVEAIGSGSFKAQIKSIYKGVGNLFSKDNLKNIVLNIIASYIFLHTLQPDSNVNVTIKTDEVIIEHENKHYHITRNTYDTLKYVEKNPKFINGIGRAVRTTEDDQDIKYLGISRSMNEIDPNIKVTRENFPNFTKSVISEDIKSRTFEEFTDIEITKAILEKSKRKWEFVWHGMKISAPVCDQKFYDDFFSHKITIAPGDALSVRLLVRQKKMKELGIFINESYEVIEVIKHIPKSIDKSLSLN